MVTTIDTGITAATITTGVIATTSGTVTMRGPASDCDDAGGPLRTDGVDAPCSPASMCHSVVVDEESPQGEETSTMQVTTMGIDLAKNVFQVHGVDASGRLSCARLCVVRSYCPSSRIWLPA